MKKHFRTILKVEQHLQKKNGVLTENTSENEDFLDYDISITSSTKNDLVSTFTIKHNNTYKNDKVCIEFRKMVDDQFVPSGIGSSTSDYLILTFYDDRNFYMIRRSKILEYVFDIRNTHVPKYISMDRVNCQLAIFDRPSLLRRCTII
jgi:hypothetical protein